MQLWLNPNRNRPCSRRRPQNPMNSRTRRTRTNRICVWIDKAGAVWLNLSPSCGRLPKWPTGADCKSAGYAFDGSNPSPTTTFARGEARTKAAVPERSEGGLQNNFPITGAPSYGPASQHFRFATPHARSGVADLRFGSRRHQASNEIQCEG